MSKNYWDLTNRPHTRRKLIILNNYLKVWASIILNHGFKYKRSNFQTAYYIDCFAGRGKYHLDKNLDSEDGSPLIALKWAQYFNKKYNNKVELRCFFIENNPKYIKELRKFCAPFKKTVNFEIIPGDVNKKIDKIMQEIKSNATFFFIDPCKLKHLDHQTVKTITSKKGPKDIILNYICGTNRVIGKIKSQFKKGKVKMVKGLVRSIACFHTLPILKECFEKSDLDRLKAWEKQIFKDTELKEKLIYEMTSSFRDEPVYYLLFASRRPIAKKIMKDILEKEDRETLFKQTKMFPDKVIDL